MSLLMPHLWWSIASDFPTIKYALTKTARPWPVGFLKAVETASAVVLMLAFPAVVLARSLWNRHGSHGSFTASMKERVGTALSVFPVWVIFLALAPLSLTLLLAFFGLTKPSLNFIIPTIFMLSILAVGLVESKMSNYAIRKIWRVGWVVLFATLFIAPIVGVATIVADLGQSNKYSAIAAKRAAEAWVVAFGQPVKIVSGTEPFSLAQPFYVSKSPQEFSHFDFDESPWITRERIARDGLLSICLVGDVDCLRSASQYSNRGTQVVAETLQFVFWGVSLRPASLVFVMTPPTDFEPSVFHERGPELVRQRRFGQ
jgi:hypothetical protein